MSAITQKQFQERLIKLIEAGHKAGLCPACMLRDLLIVSDAIIAATEPPPSILEAHGIRELPSMTVTSDATTANIGARH